MQLNPIGVIHSPYKERGQAPRQGRLSEGESTLEIFPPFVAALKDIERSSHLIVLYWGDRADRETLQSRTPFSEIPVGVFASRSPNRPNPIAFCVATLIRREGDRLIVRGVDALDGSPLLDIKAYAPALDCVPDAVNRQIPADQKTLTHTTPALLDEALLEQRRRLQGLSQGFREAQVLLTCVELGVFEALNDGPAAAATVAQQVGADPRGTELLLNAAVALELLDKTGGQFRNKPLVAACLLPGAPDTLARSIHLQAAFYRRWGRLAEAVRTGRRPEEDRRDEQAEDWVRSFVYGLYAMARPLAPAIADALALPDGRPLRVIDVGGCHAAYSLALARRHPLLTATIFELPAVVPHARAIVAQAGLAQRVTVQEGDFQREGLGSGYDVALVFGVLNGEPLAGRPALIRKVYDCLNPGGRIVLRDFVLDDDRAGPPDAAIFALQMLLATESGGLDTRGDWAGWLAAASFAPPQIVALPAGMGALTVADKPT